MKLGIISDIHSNLPALEAVMASFDKEEIDKIICLGDIVGYGARPNECVSLIQDQGIPCILGNHDEAAIGSGDIKDFNHWARAAIEWTAIQLDTKSQLFLSNLKFTLVLENLLFVHSTPYQPQAWRYLFSNFDARQSFSVFKQKLCFIGHTHIPASFNEDRGYRRILNVGSVGQPRDRDPRACWGVYDTEDDFFKWVRVEYLIKEAASQIISAGLPRFLADRLSSGI
ncbi:MAG: metallophosphoesterase family protein [Candidatus Hatepunaea meridiana]|nr:metallophosphoesterase family protein [Candidatus Hatepunaea meridiana]